MATHAHSIPAPTVQPHFLRGGNAPSRLLSEPEVLALVGEVPPLLCATVAQNAQAEVRSAAGQTPCRADTPQRVASGFPKSGDANRFDIETLLPAPAPLPTLTAAFSRRRAIFGAVVLAAAPVAALPAVASTIALSQADARLMALVDELQTGAVALVDLANSDPRDCDEIPGYLAAEDRLSSIIAELHEIRAESMVGIVAVARALQVPFVSEDYQITGDLAWNLADDILRICGGRAHV